MDFAGPEPKLSRREYLLAALAPLFGVLVLWGPRILNGENIYLGAVQEQYYLLGQYSFDHLIRDEFGAGQFPLWNPNNALGAPLLGNMLSAAFYPLKIFLYLWPGLAAYQLYVIFRFWLAGFFSYILGRKLRLSIAGSLAVLFGFCFSGYFQFYLNENYLNADFLLPLLLLLGLKISTTRSKKWPALAALSLFALFNSGHPEAIFYDWLFMVLSVFGFSLTADKKDRRGIAARFGLANVAAIFLSLPLILTFLEYWVRGYHFHLPGAGLYHYSIKEFLAVFSPWFFGPGKAGAAFFHAPALGGKISGLIPAYSQSSLPWLAPSLGLVFLPLLALAFMSAQKIPAIYRVWTAWLIFFLGFSFGLPVFHVLGLFFPFSLSGNFKHPWPGLVLSASLLSGWVLDKIWSREMPAWKIWAALLVSAAALLVFFPLRHAGTALNPETLLELGLAVLFFGWLCFANGSERAEIPGTAILVCLLLFSALLRDRWQAPVYPDYNLTRLRQSRVFDRVRKDNLQRFYFEREVFPANINQLLGLEGLSVMDGVNHKKFVELVNFINGHNREQAFEYWYNKVGYLEVMPDKVENSLLDLCAVKYIITKTPLPYNRSIDRILETGSILAPSAQHVGLAYFPDENARAKTLFQHPASRIVGNRCSLKDLNGSRGVPDYCKSMERDCIRIFSLSFFPRIQAGAVSKEPDGVWFMASHIGVDQRSKLGYARYIHPKKHAHDNELARVKLTMPACGVFSLVTLPGNGSDYDWSGWMDLRVDEPETLERLTLLGSDQFWFYENEQALPMFFMAESGEWEPEKTGTAKPVPDLRHEVVFFKEAVQEARETQEFSNARIRVTDHSSQAYALEAGTADPGWLSVSQIFYPGWRVFVDGAESRLEPASFLSALQLPAGGHRIKIIYQPWSFRIALYFSLASLFSLLAVALVKGGKPGQI
jgi:hypothetical protein